MFGLVDSDASGAISQAELAQHMKLRGYDDDEIARAVKSIDTDGDGQISAAEFVAALEGDGSRPELEDLLKPFEAPDAVFEVVRSSGGCDLSELGERAISLAQLKHVYLDQVVNRCPSEGWIGRRQDGGTGQWSYARLTPETVNLYDAMSYVLLPASGVRECSFVELLATAPQTPEWFVSVSWSHSLLGLIRCLEAHARDHGLDEHAHYWIAAFALNQHPSSDDAKFWTSALSRTPMQTSFASCWALPCQGIVHVIDEEATYFGRSWCAFEQLVGLVNPPHAPFERAFYTPFAHEFQVALDSPYKEMRMAVGLLAGGLARDAENSDALETAAGKARREAAFPVYLLERGLELDLEATEASRPEDRARILNSILGNEAKPKAKVRKGHPGLQAASAMLAGDIAALGLTKVIDGNLVIHHGPPPGSEEYKRKKVAEEKKGKRAPPPPPPTVLDEAKQEVLATFLASIKAGSVRRLRVDLASAGTTADDGGKTFDQILEALVPPPPPPEPEPAEGEEKKEAEEAPPAKDAGSIETLELLHSCIATPPLRLLGFESLITLRLTHTPFLTSFTPSKLLLERTERAEKTSSWINHLPNLAMLDLSGCTAIELLPDGLFSLEKLSTLLLAGCSMLQGLPPLVPMPEGEDPAPAGSTGGSRLALLDISHCPQLYFLPDFTGLAGLEVKLEGCLRELMEAYAMGGGKPINVEYAL